MRAAVSLVLGVVVVACGPLSPKSSSNLAQSMQEDLRRFDEAQFAAVTRRIYDGGISLPIANLPRNAERGILVLENDEETRDIKRARKTLSMIGQKLVIPANVGLANQHSKDLLRFYREQFGRNSYDGVGSAIQISVDVNREFRWDPMFRKNAMWLPTEAILVFGANTESSRAFVRGSDVVGHEFTHAVISATSNLQYAGQSGALNEHFADVFGEMYQWWLRGSDARFLIGESVVDDGAVPLRNMLTPAQGSYPQPGHMSEIDPRFAENCQPDRNNDNCGVHILSGIPNLFAARVIAALDWKKVRDIFYVVMTQELGETSQFADYAAAMRRICPNYLGEAECRVIDQELTSVGL